MHPLENQPVKQPQQGAEFGYEPPPLYVFTGDGKESKTPSLYQFSGNPEGQEVKTGPQVYLGPVGQDWGPRIGPAERRIDQMPEGPEKQRALARETNVLFNVPVALKAYRDDIKAADAIDQADVARRNTDNVTLLKQNEAQIAQARAANAAPEQMNALLKKQDELQTNQKLIVNDYYAPATTRINAGLALITTGQDMLVDYGQNLIDEGLKLRPELSSNSEFRKNLEAARQACIKNREAAFSGEVGNPYQFSGDGTVPGGIPQKKPGVPGQPGLGGDGKPLPNGNPGFTPIPGYDAPPPNATPFPTFKRGGETPPNARKDLPKPPQPVENFAPPQKQEKPKEAQADKSLWDQASDGQKLVAAALAAYLGYKLVQRGNRIALERSRDAGNEALGKTPENAAKLKEAIERAGQEMARDNFVKAEMVKEGEHAGKYEVTGADGKKKYLSEAEFKERFTETGKPGEYKDVYSGKSKAVKLPDLGELNKELGLGDQATRKLWAVSENGEVKLLTDKEFKQTWRQPTEADKASWEKEAESKLTPEERAAKEKAAAEKLEAEKKAAEEKAAAEKLEAEKKAAEEKAAVEKLEAEKKAAEEKAAAEKLEAEKKAAEEKAAAEKLEAEKKAAEEKAAAEKLEAEKKAAEEKAAAEKLEAEKKAAEEKAAAEKLEAEKKAAEEKAAAEKLEAEKKAAEEKAAAEKLEAEKKAAEEKAAAEKLEAEKKAAEEKAAAEKLEAEKKAAEEKAAAEKLEAEKKAAEEKAAAEKLEAEKKAAEEKAAAEKLEAEKKAAEEKAAAEKLEAEKKAAEEKAAAEKLEAEKKAAEEKAAAEKLEAEKKAAEEKAAAERFRPTTGTEILKGVKVGDVAEVEGAKWSAVGKVEDRVIVRKEGAIEPGIMAQKFEPEKFNRVEIAGESGVFFQRKGTDKIYKHSTVNGAEPVVGQPSLLLVSGLEAKTAGSEIVKALRGDGKSAAKPVEKPAAEPPKADLSKVKSPMSNEKLKLFVDRVENGLTQENMIEELQTRSKEFFGQEGSEQFREVVGRTKFAENAELKAGESKTVYKVGDQSFEPKSFEASPAPGRFVTADGKKVELNDCRIEIQLGKGTTPEQAVRESLLNYNRLNEQVAGTGEGAGTAADLKPTREAVEMKLTEALDVARGKIAPGGAIPSEAAAIAVKLGDFEVGGKTLEVSLTVRGINIGGKEFSSTEVVEMTMKETQKKMNEAKTEMERKALADSLEELKKLHQDVREGKPVEIAKLNESLAGNLKHSYEAIKAGERPGETKPGEVGGRIKGGVGRAGAYLMVTAFVASLLVDRKSSGGTSGADYAPTTVR